MMLRFKLVSALVFLSISIGIASAEENAEPTWESIHSTQPEGTGLELILEKDHFAQGESIDATLRFSDASEHSYSIRIGAGYPGVVFHALDSAGNPVIDPRQGLSEWQPIAIIGPSCAFPIKGYVLSLLVNNQLSFSQPGIYALYAQAEVAETIGWHANTAASPIYIVSQKVTVTIDPLTSEKAQVLLTEANRKIAAGGDLAITGVTELGYLQTPEAYAKMVSLLNDSNLLSSLYRAFQLSPNPSREAASIMAAVKKGQITLNGLGLDLYATLKTADMYKNHTRSRMTEAEIKQFNQDRWSAETAARDEIATAQVEAAGQGPQLIEALFVAYQESLTHPDPYKLKARKTLAEHQMELPPADVNFILESWNPWGSDDFLPLVRQRAAPPIYNPKALAALALTKPNEALTLIQQDSLSSHSKYFSESDPMLWVNLPVTFLPELTPVIHEALQKKDANLKWLLDFTDRYGTADLLPDIIALYNHPPANESKEVACEIEHKLLRLWIKWDAKGGVEALTAAMAPGGPTSCPHPPIDVLWGNWTPEALPLLLKTLEGSDVNVVTSAIQILNQNANPQYAEAVITALERISSGHDDKDQGTHLPQLGAGLDTAQFIAANSQWQLTPAQKERLQALSAAPAAK